METKGDDVITVIEVIAAAKQFSEVHNLPKTAGVHCTLCPMEYGELVARVSGGVSHIPERFAMRVGDRTIMIDAAPFPLPPNVVIAQILRK